MMAQLGVDMICGSHATCRVPGHAPSLALPLFLNSANAEGLNQWDLGQIVAQCLMSRNLFMSCGPHVLDEGSCAST